MSDAQRILLVEDDPSLALGLVDTLEFEGFEVVHAERGEEAIEAVRAGDLDCILLDVMLPDLNGFQVCERVRRKDPRVPILMLTARGQEVDKIRGLESGADDYVTKPFGVGELVARIRALLRRATRVSALPEQPFVVAGKTVDPAKQTLSVPGREELALSFHEARVLALLYAHAGEPVTRDAMMEEVWGTEASPTTRTVDNLIVKLRKKLEASPDKPQHILTVYGVGYKLVP
ncbi:MAG: response regulator transcription factor [Myxococcota bacterium]